MSILKVKIIAFIHFLFLDKNICTQHGEKQGGWVSAWFVIKNMAARWRCWIGVEFNKTLRNFAEAFRQKNYIKWVNICILGNTFVSNKSALSFCKYNVKTFLINYFLSTIFVLVFVCKCKCILIGIFVDHCLQRPIITIKSSSDETQVFMQAI